MCSTSAAIFIELAPSDKTSPRAELERRSDELATNILESLSDQATQRAHRGDEAEQLLRASMITFGIELHLYRRSGYVEVEAFNAEPYAHHWFEKQLVCV